MSNIKTFYAHEKSIIEDLDKINDQYFMLESKNKKTEIVVPIFLLLTTHKSFIACITLLQSLQLSSCYTLTRSILESSAYAYYIDHDKKRKNIYISRNLNKERENDTKKEFTIKKICKYIRGNNIELCNKFEKLYNEAIDKGAHPNIENIRPYFTVNEKFEYKYDFFETREEIIVHTSSHIIEVGYFSIKMFKEILDA